MEKIDEILEDLGWLWDEDGVPDDYSEDYRNSL